MSAPVRTLLASLALAAATACSADVQPPSEKEARDAGRDYGETIRDTVGSRATAEEMEDLCGQGAVEEGVVPQGGREGDETDLEVDAFIEGCRDAVDPK